MSAVMPIPAANPATRSLLPRPLAVFWRWWAGELHGVFDPLVEKYWVDHANVVTIALDAGGAIPTNARLDGRDVRILLPAEHVLQKTATYPAAVDENLDEVLANDLDRQTPFTPEQVYTAHRIERRYDGADGAPKIDVALTMVLRRLADNAMDRVRAAGGRVYSLGVAGDNQHLELLPLAARPARRLTPLQKINIGLLVALLVLIIASLVTPIVMLRSQIKILAPLVDKARVEAEATRKIETEFQRLQQEYQLATGKKYASYPLLDVVEEMTRLSPDTTWLQSFEMKYSPGATKGSSTKLPVREIQIIGEAASASKMIELLEQSTLLQNTTQRAQTTRGAQPNTERFQIATEIKPRSAPEMIDLFAAADSAAANAPTPAPTPAPAMPDATKPGVAAVSSTPAAAAPRVATPTAPPAAVGKAAAPAVAPSKPQTPPSPSNPSAPTANPMPAPMPSSLLPKPSIKP